MGVPGLRRGYRLRRSAREPSGWVFKPQLSLAGEHMELVGGIGATHDAGDRQAEPEVAGLTQVTWRKSSWSSFNGNCIQSRRTARCSGGVRDSKERGLGPVLLFNDPAWRSFIDGVKNGHLLP